MIYRVAIPIFVGLFMAMAGGIIGQATQHDTKTQRETKEMVREINKNVLLLTVNVAVIQTTIGAHHPNGFILKRDSLPRVYTLNKN